ncbi:MAG: translation elongation factor Ts [Planctomycetaceae bacterium]|jgi:elongation factor Ts|nr:translation elongation factor Ts [Planctomycetaceae bacterium]
MEISASQVKAFRDKTGLPMMDCKRALVEAEGDEDKAVEILRKSGAKTMAGRTDRITQEGRIVVFTDKVKNVTAMIELLCESEPVSNNAGFESLANALAEQLATGPGATTPEELLTQPFPNKSGVTLKQFLDELANKIREVFRLSRIARIEGNVSSYVHHNKHVAALLAIDGLDSPTVRDICMQVASMNPQYFKIEDIDPSVVAKELEIQTKQAKQRNPNKPDNILQKIIDGLMKTYYAERVLLAQPFIKDSSKTVQQVCNEAHIEIKKSICWILGQEKCCVLGQEN